MATSQQQHQAIQHLEDALKLTSLEFIQTWIASKKSGKRGRPAATPASADKRCAWILMAGDQCKNARHETNSFCRMHLNKIEIVDGGM